MRHNRIGIPNEIKSTDGRELLGSKTIWEKNDGDLNLTSYVVSTSKGMKNVLVLSTVRPIQGVTKDDGKKKPAIIKLYDFTKIGTDNVDQRMGTYSCKSKSCKWTLVGMTYILDTIRVNSQTVHALHNNKKTQDIDSFNFGWSLAEELVMPHVRRRSRMGLSKMTLMKVSIVLAADGRQEPAARAPAANPAQRKRCSTCLAALSGVGHKINKNKLPKNLSRCSMCQNGVCSEHMVVRCHNCIP